MKPFLKFSFSLIASACCFIQFSCSKEYSAEGGILPVPDTVLTENSLFVDITLDGKRIFHKSNWTDTGYNPSNYSASLTWGPVHWWGTTYIPDSIYYPYNGIKGGLWNEKSITATPAFLFLINSYGTYLPPYSKIWWSPLMKKTIIDSIFHTGNFTYAVPLNKDTTYTPCASCPAYTQKLLSSGIQLTWWDENGKIWQTTSGSANQATSYFTITRYNPRDFIFLNNPQYSDYYLYYDQAAITANFDCILYDGLGHSMHITNGRFRFLLRFGLR